MKTQLSHLQQKQTFLKIFIFTFVTVMIWVGLTLFRTQQRPGITPLQQKMAEPLNPNINAEVFDLVEQKKFYSPEELTDFPIYALVTVKGGEKELVVFSASDRSQKFAETLATEESVDNSPEAAQPAEPTPESSEPPASQLEPAPEAPTAPAGQ